MNFSSNFEYRKFLTNNGKTILNSSLNNAVNYQQCNCNYYTVPSTPLTSNSPFLFDNIMQKDTPYGYTESDLKTNFIKELMNNRLLTIRAAENVVRILPPLNVKKNEIDLAIKIINKVCKRFN